MVIFGGWWEILYCMAEQSLLSRHLPRGRLTFVQVLLNPLPLLVIWQLDSPIWANNNCWLIP